jgi:hypothetical protein
LATQAYTDCPLFDYLVGAGEQRRWNREAKRLGGFEVEIAIRTVNIAKCSLTARTIETNLQASTRERHLPPASNASGQRPGASVLRGPALSGPSPELTSKRSRVRLRLQTDEGFMARHGNATLSGPRQNHSVWGFPIHLTYEDANEIAT